LEKISLPLTFDVASRADTDALLKFYQEMYPRLGWTKPYFDWQYYANPAGNAHTWVARAGEDIVSSMTAIPHEVLVRGEKRLGWRVQDLLTRPEYGGFGIYHTFSKMANKFLRRPEFPLNFTFPNEKSHKGFISIGWTQAFRVPLRILEDLGSVKEEAVKAKVAPIRSFGEEVDAIWNAYSNCVSFTLNRSSQYLKWRYLMNPKGKYSPFILSLGKDRLVMVLKYYDRENGERWAHLCDLFQAGENKELTEAAVKYAICFAHEMGSKSLSCWSVPTHAADPILERNRFRLQKDLNRWVVVNVNAMDAEPFWDASRWHLSMGDTDVF